MKALLAAVGAASVMVLVGCSSSPGTAPTTAPVTTPGSTSPASTNPGSTSPGSSTSTSGPVATSTTPTEPPTTASVDITAAVTDAFVTFFDGADPDIEAKVAALEGGAALRSMIADAMADPQFATLSTEVRSVTPLTDQQCVAAGERAPCAEVIHDMFLGGMPAFVGRTSHAVLVDGHWLVSRSSWCSIVEIGGDSCPAA